MKQRSGVALILCICLTGALMLLAVILTKIVYNSYATVELIGQREKAFWLAEAGLEAGKVRLAKNPGWYTDLPHFPADDVKWLKGLPVGETGTLPSGVFLMVREKDRMRLYSIGTAGKSRVFLSLEFIVMPFKTVNYSEI